MSAELTSIYEAAQIERFKAQAVIDNVIKILERKLKAIVKDKYSELRITHEGMDFGLFAVRAINQAYITDPLLLPNFNVRLTFMVTSKLPKDKAEKLEEAKRIWREEEYFPHNNLKVQLWHTLSYTISFQDAVKGNISLKVDLH